MALKKKLCDIWLIQTVRLHNTLVHFDVRLDTFDEKLLKLYADSVTHLEEVKKACAHLEPEDGKPSTSCFLYTRQNKLRYS